MAECKWKDVTFECEVDPVKTTTRGYIHLKHEGNIIGIRKEDSEQGNYRFRFLPYHSEIGQYFVVEKKESFTFVYDEEFVNSLDCESLDDISLLQHCLDHWEENVQAHEVGVNGSDIPADCNTCVACKKYFGAKGKCPLWDGERTCHCGLCFKAHQDYRDNPCEGTARKVRDYIQGKLDELKEGFKIGDKVAVSSNQMPPHEKDRTATVLCIKGEDVLVFNSNWRNGHCGTTMFTFADYKIEAFPLSHWIVDLYEITAIPDA